MRLLIVTDVLDVDDLTVGYFHRWVEEIAKHCTSIEIITTKQGYHTLPAHVHVHSLGWEVKKGRIHRFVKYLWFLVRLTRQYDAVFVYDTPWVVAHSGWWWRLWKKKVGLWYAYGDSRVSLQCARLFLSFIFTPTTHGYHGGGDVKHIVGHGVDTAKFHPIMRPKHDGVFRMVTVGDISPTKDYETFIRAVSLLNESIDKPFTVTVVGAPRLGKEAFAEEVRTFSRSFGLGEVVTFFGPMKNAEVAKLHQAADLYISLNIRPALEKSIIEAAASGLPILTSNQSFDQFAAEYREFVYFEQENDVELAERIRHAMKMSYEARHALGQVFRAVAVSSHSTEVLAKGIVDAYKQG